MSKSKFQWRVPAIIWGGWLLLIVIAKLITLGNHYKVVHNAAVASTVGKDGRAAVGSPESYTVWSSPKAAHKMMKPVLKVLAVVAWIFFFAAGAFLLAGANDIIAFGPNTSAPNFVLVVLMGLGIIFTVAGYSSVFADHFIDLTAAEYAQVRDNKEAILQLFIAKFK